jgi:ubiquinone/menaquinone biosynthesis C-methylase UbiE
MQMSGEDRGGTHVCPWWVGYLLASPLRRLWESPGRLLGEHVRGGMTVLEVGPAMGFFTIPAARMVGPGGRVVAVDVQERMIGTLRRRVERAGLSGRVECRVCDIGSLGVDDLEGKVDLVLLIHVVHEIPDRAGLFDQVRRALAPGGSVLVVEPAAHVEHDEFLASIEAARGAGLEVTRRPRLARRHAAVCQPMGGRQ